MKKGLSISVLACIFCLLSTFGTACSCQDNTLSEIYFDKSTINLTVGDSIDYTAEGLGLYFLPSTAEDVKFYYTVEQDRNTSGARVTVLEETKDSLVARNPGIATITAKCRGLEQEATLTIRVFERNYTLDTPTGIQFKSSQNDSSSAFNSQAIVWDKQYLSAGSHTDIDEVKYNIELNGTVVESTSENSFYNYESGVWNTLRIQATTLKETNAVKSSKYCADFKFYVLNEPSNVKFNNQTLTWDAVENAESYNVVVYKKGDISLNFYKEINNITETTCNLEINEAGNFSVEVKAVPNSESAGMYISKGSDAVSIIKYDEIKNLTVKNDNLIWNAVVGTSNYNIVLTNNKTNEVKRIPVSVSPELSECSYDLTLSNMVGDFTIRIETLSNTSAGINSETSQVCTEATICDVPKFKGISENKLRWEALQSGCTVEIKVGETNLGPFETYFELPEQFVAGTYNISARIVGNGTNIVSSRWFNDSEIYSAIKLETPTNLSISDHEITVNSINNAYTYALIDVCNEYSLPCAGIKVDSCEKDETSSKVKFSMADKVTDVLDLYKNKYELKIKAVGASNSNCFDSDYSKESVTFVRLLPISNSYGYKSDDLLKFYTGGYFDYKVLNIAENNEIFNELVVNDGNSTFVKMRLIVNRVSEDGEETIFQRAVSTSSTTLTLQEIYNTSGGKLNFKIGYEGNGTTILSSILTTSKLGEENNGVYISTDSDLVMYRAYEANDFKVNGSTVSWSTEVNELGDDFVVFNSTALQVNSKSQDNVTYAYDVSKSSILKTSSKFCSLKDYFKEENKIETIYVQNLITYKNKNTYWWASKVTSFDAKKLSTPTINFNGSNIEISSVDDAVYYNLYRYVDSNYELIYTFNASEIENGKISFDYENLLKNLYGEINLVVQSSMGKDSSKIYIDSSFSNMLIVKNMTIQSVEIKDHNIIFTPNEFDYSSKLIVEIKQRDSTIKSLDLAYNTELKNYNFNPQEYLTTSGYYDIAFVLEYSGTQGENVRYKVNKKITIQNIIYVTTEVEAVFVNNGGNLINWSLDEKLDSYNIVVKNVDTAQIEKEISIEDKTQKTFNLENLTGLKTNAHYQVAVRGIAKANLCNPSGEDYKLGIDSSSDCVDLKQIAVAYFNSNCKFVEKYNNDNAFFTKISDITDVATTIDGNIVTIEWGKTETESNIIYYVYANDELFTTTEDKTVSYSVNVSSESVVQFTVKGVTKDAQNFNYSSNISNIATVEVLKAVTNLKVQGQVYFEHDKEDCKYLVTVTNAGNNQQVYSTEITAKALDLSEVNEINSTSKYIITVQAISNGINYISSNSVSSEQVSRVGSLTLELDSATKSFKCNELNWVKFFAQYYDEEEAEFTTVYSSELIRATGASFRLDEVENILPGKYKVWVVSQSSENIENELYSQASNYYYVTLQTTATGVKLQDGVVTFTPVESCYDYLVVINGSEKSLHVSDTSVNVSFSADLYGYNSAGDYTVNIVTVGSYDNTNTSDYSITIDSVKTEDFKFTKLTAPTNVKIEGKSISWDTVENAQGYQLVFTSSDAQDVKTFTTLSNSYDFSNIAFGSNKYSCEISAIGKDSVFLIASESTSSGGDFQLVTTDNLDLTFDVSTKKLTWTNSDNAVYGYTVVFTNESNEIVSSKQVGSTITSLEIPEDVEAGTYNIHVVATGNGSTVLDGNKSNVLNLTKLQKVTNAKKTQTDEQSLSGKACIYFEHPVATHFNIKISYNNVEVCTFENFELKDNVYPEYDFASAGEYLVEITALGNYTATVDSSKTTLTIIKLAQISNLQTNYKVEFNKNHTSNIDAIKVNLSASWNTVDISSNIQYYVEMDSFMNKGIKRVDTSSFVTATNVSISEYLENIDLSKDYIKFRTVPNLDDSNIIASNWTVLNVNILNTPVLSNVCGENLNFMLDNEDNISKAFIIVYKGEDIVLGTSLDFTSNAIEIASALESLVEGEYSIQMFVYGDSPNYLSNVSDKITFTKLVAPSIKLEYNVDDNFTGSAKLVWDKNARASGYKIFASYFKDGQSKNQETLHGVDNVSLDTDAQFSSLGTTEINYQFVTVGKQGYLNSNKSITYKIIQETETPKLKIESGLIKISNWEDLNNKFNNSFEVVLNILNKNYRMTSDTFELDSSFDGGKEYTIKAKLVKTTFNKVEQEDSVSYTLNSNFSEETATVYKLANTPSFTIKDGVLYVQTVYYNLKEDESKAKLEINFGSTSKTVDIQCYTDETKRASNSIPVEIPLSNVLTGTTMNIKYRAVGDDNNLNGNYTSLVNTAQVLTTPNIQIKDGNLYWEKVENVSYYQVYVVYDYTYIKDEKEEFVQFSGETSEEKVIENAMITFTIDANATIYTVDELINKVRANKTITDSSGNTINISIKDSEDLGIKFVVKAIGSNKINTDGNTYLTSANCFKTITQLKQIQKLEMVAGKLKCESNYKLTIKDSNTSVLPQEVYSNYDDIFSKEGTYTIAVQQTGDGKTTFNSLISSDFTVYKLPDIANVTVDSEGFIQLKIQLDLSKFNGIDNISNITNIAIKSIDISVPVIENEKTTLRVFNFNEFKELEISQDGNNYTITLSANYDGDKDKENKKGFIDLLEYDEALSMLIKVVGSTTGEDNNIIIESSNNKEVSLNKLDAPADVIIYDSKFKWTAIDNEKCIGYAITIAESDSTTTESDNLVSVVKIYNDRTLNFIDLTNKELFKDGYSYTLSIRALGNGILNSKSSDLMSFHVYKKQDVKVLNGDICVNFSDSATQAEVVLVKSNDSYEYKFKVNISETGLDGILELPDVDENEKAIDAGNYSMKVKALGNGTAFIDSEYSNSIAVVRVDKVANVKAINGALQWSIIKTSKGDNILKYKITMAQNGEEDISKIVEVSADSIVNGLVTAELPLDFYYVGNVNVKVKAIGINDLSGQNSTIYNAIKIDTISNLKVVDSGDVSAIGNLAWSYNSSIPLRGYSLVMIVKGESGYYYLEDSAVVNSTITVVPTTLAGKSISNGSIYRLSVKALAKEEGYLSSLPKVQTKNDSNTIYVSRLGSPSVNISQKSLVLADENSWNTETYGKLQLSSVTCHKNDTINASSDFDYRIEFKNVSTLTSKNMGPYKSNFNEDFSNIDAGTYNISVYALGGKSFNYNAGEINNDETENVSNNTEDDAQEVEDGVKVYYITGNPETLTNVYKLKAPKISISEPNKSSDSGSSSKSEVKITLSPSMYSVQNTNGETINGYATDYLVHIVYRSSNSTSNEYKIITPKSESNAKINEYTDDFEALIGLKSVSGEVTITVCALTPKDSNIYVLNSNLSEKAYATIPKVARNLIFDNNYKKYTWSPPEGYENEELIYTVYYLKGESNNGVETWDSVESEFETSSLEFFPPSLGLFKCVISVKTKNSVLESDKLGSKNGTDYTFGSAQLSESSLDLPGFISKYGVKGNNTGLFDGGQGTSDDPYIISTVVQFNNMKYYCSRSDVYFEINNSSEDSVWSNVSFESLTSSNNGEPQLAGESNPFKAHFNGNGVTIKISSNAGFSTKCAIFPYTEGAEIKNLTVIVNSEIGLSGSKNYVMGVLVGTAKDTIFENISVNAKITLNSGSSGASYESKVGGIVGYSTGGTTFKDVNFAGQIAYDSSLDNTFASTTYNVCGIVGGIVGELDNTNTSINFVFENCYNSATLQGTVVGGIAGKTNIGAKNCFNLGKVYSFMSTGRYIMSGGIFGQVTAENSEIYIVSCYNKGTLTLNVYNPTNAQYLGGLVGAVETSISSTLNMIHCFNAGEIKNASSGATNKNQVRGFFIGNSSPVQLVLKYCYNVASVLSDVNYSGNESSSSGMVTSNLYCEYVNQNTTMSEFVQYIQSNDISNVFVTVGSFSCEYTIDNDSIVLKNVDEPTN